jgi:hypothetical protein
MSDEVQSFTAEPEPEMTKAVPEQEQQQGDVGAAREGSGPPQTEVLTLEDADRKTQSETKLLEDAQPEPELQPEPEQEPVPGALVPATGQPPPAPSDDIVLLSEPMLAVLASLGSRRQALHDVHSLQYRSGACAVSDALLAAAKRAADARPKTGSTAAERDALMALLVDLQSRIVEMTECNFATQWPADPPVRASPANALLHLLGMITCACGGRRVHCLSWARCQTY